MLKIFRVTVITDPASSGKLGPTMAVTIVSTFLFRSTPSHRYFRLESGWKSIVESSETQSRELRSNVHVFVTVIYPLSSVFVNDFAR